LYGLGKRTITGDRKSRPILEKDSMTDFRC